MIEGIGLFIWLAGFVIGLGAVTVIDVHGLLGRTSSYWTEATTRTHKVTKPLIWLGTVLAIVGGSLFYSVNELSWITWVHAGIAVVLVLNGLFLSFSVSPYLLVREREGKSGETLPVSWQRKIAVSLVFSDVGWWSALALLVVVLMS